MAVNLDYLSVSQLTSLIKKTLEGSFPAVAIQGEISNLKVQSSGHIYFTLKDRDAAIFCACFRGYAAQLKALPKEGDQVRIQGEINVYPPRGNYQLIVKRLEPIGVGELLIKFQELKAKLERFGWFAKERKRALPRFPKRIGVVTSPTGAVIRDIIHVLDRRVGKFHLVLNPVKVQGPGAAEEIAAAIGQFNKYKLADVLIVGRGGGSFEDLFCFSEGVVARAIYESQIPVISAVGHETDFAISDFVADLRAPTPSAAAEIVMGETAQMMQWLQKARVSLDNQLIYQINHLKTQLLRFAKHPLLSDPYALLGMRHQRLDEFKNGIERALLYRLKNQKVQLDGLRRTLESRNPRAAIHEKRILLTSHQKNLKLALKRILEHSLIRFKHLTSSLEAVRPEKILSRGYAILFSQKEKSVISEVSKLQSGQLIVAKVSDGEATLQVVKND